MDCGCGQDRKEKSMGNMTASDLLCDILCSTKHGIDTKRLGNGKLQKGGSLAGARELFAGALLFLLALLVKESTGSTKSADWATRTM